MIADRIKFRFLVAKRGVSYYISDLLVRFDFPYRYSTKRAADAYADKLVAAEAERQESVHLLDGWCL